MKLVKCEKVENHFYDGDKYSSCPFCGGKNDLKVTKQEDKQVKYPSEGGFIIGDSDETICINGTQNYSTADVTIQMYEQEEDAGEYDKEQQKEECNFGKERQRIFSIPLENGRERCVNCFEEHEQNLEKCPYCGYKAGDGPSEMYHIFPGFVLNDRYVIGKVLGFGGFGITYKAWDKKLDTVTAVKEYYPGTIVNRAAETTDVVIYANKRRGEYLSGKQRFLVEARNMAKFNSEKNIVNVFEFFEENNTAYIVMEYLKGITLSEYLHENGKVSVDFGLKVTNDICFALQKLHSHGIIHRDISPDNIFLCDDGGVKLIDFGAARFAKDEDKQLTIILKPGFAPCEQYEKINKQGAWTDIYALGATLYYIITGVKPEESTNRKVKDTLPPPREINGEISENLSNTIMKSMAIDVNLRFKTVKEFSDALNKNKKIIPIDKERKRRKVKRFAGVALAVAILGGGTAVVLKSWNDEKQSQTLPDSEISMWYCKSGDDKLDEEELAAYQGIADDFNESFPNVKIIIKGFEPEEYEKALKEGEQPNIYEYVDVDSCGKNLSLESVYETDSAKECEMLAKAEGHYGGCDYLPLGYSVPVIFRNTAVEGTFAKKIQSSKDFSCQINSSEIEHNVLTDSNIFLKMYGLHRSKFDEDSAEKFYSNKVLFYGTYSDNYFDVMQQMAGRYEICRCDAKKVFCKYENVWCANDLDKDENKASIRLLEFMLSNNAQDELHIQNSSHNLPINDNILEDYTNVYNEMEQLLLNKEKFIFK